MGDLFRPKSFAGIFGAAPSVALATLTLTIAQKGPQYAGIEARSMILGAVALGIYSMAVMWTLMRGRLRTPVVTLAWTALWLAASFALAFAFLRPLR